MVDDGSARVGLADFLAQLQVEIGAARGRGGLDAAGFGVDEVTLDIAVSLAPAQSDDPAHAGKLRLWVDGRERREADTPSATQRLSVRAVPEVGAGYLEALVLPKPHVPPFEKPR